MSTEKIFINYKSEDKNFILKINSSLLEQISNSVWFDKKISPGDRWNDIIKKKICESTVVMICLGKKKIQEESYQEKEICIAIIREICEQCRIIPTIIPGFPKLIGSKEKILDYLKKFQWIKLTTKIEQKEKDELNNQLLKALNEIRELRDEKIDNFYNKQDNHEHNNIPYENDFSQNEMTLCVKKLRKSLLRLSFDEFNKYKIIVEKVRKIFNQRKRLFFKCSIIGNDQVFEIQKALTKEIFGQIIIYEIFTKQNNKNVTTNKVPDYKKNYSNTIWDKLDSHVERKRDKENGKEDLSIDKLQQRIIIEDIINKKKENIDKPFCISFTLESDNINFKYIKEACDSFEKNLKRIIERNKKPTIFFMCVKGNNVNNVLAYCYKRKFDFRYLTIHDSGTTKIANSEEDVQLCCLKKIIDFLNDEDKLIKSETLLEELNQLICKKKEIS